MMKITRFLSVAAIALAALCATSCNQKKFRVAGHITAAKDSLLYFENMSLNGPVIVDSVKLSADGSFSFGGKAPEAPEFYRLRIAGQIVNIAIDSTESVTVKAQYPTMSSQYEVSGSAECVTIRQLALKQMQLQAQVDAVVGNDHISYQQTDTLVQALLTRYKNDIKVNYIFKAPMRASSYFALFQTVRLGDQVALIFDPRANKPDVQVFAAVATSWDTFHPGSERGKNLHNIAIEGMKNVRILQAKNSQTLPADKFNASGVLEVALPDNEGHVRRLTSLKGKVVLLDFHVFASKGSTQRIMRLRDLYNKYHAQGFEIYQVSLDPDEHFWKEQVAALPWVCVRDEDGLDSQAAAQYNVRDIPTFFLIDKNNVLQKRDVQIKDLDAEIRSML